MSYLATLIMIGAWILGIALAKGFWMTVLSLFPLAAYVNVAQWLLDGRICA